MNNPIRFLFLALLLFFGAGLVKADTLVSTLAPGNLPFNPSMGTGSAFPAQIAFPFIVPSSSNFIFTGASIALLEEQSSTTNDAFVSLATDASGHPGSILETFQLLNVLQPFGPSTSLVDLNSVIDPTLLAGDQYWLIAGPSDTGTITVWAGTLGGILPNPPETSYSLDGGATWTTTAIYLPPGAFSISGTPVSASEPTSTTLLVAGFLFFVGASALKSAVSQR